MKLEDLVPPLELCKQLKQGEFEDSAMVWVQNTQDGNAVFIDFRSVVECCGVHVDILAPAPTLAEIMAAMPDKHFYIFSASPGRWVVVCGGGDSDVDENPATAALRLYLEARHE